MKISDIIQVTVKVEVPWHVKLRQWFSLRPHFYHRYRPYWPLIWKFGIKGRQPLATWRAIRKIEDRLEDEAARMARDYRVWLGQDFGDGDQTAVFEHRGDPK